ncbi:HU family DNA-binding protein [Vibrio splendidus]|nr:HU family DNA-binding protein [Vibrio splendidus]MCC4880533.1 HU family DNA-binding protein [Vibrio splendidus]
MKKDELIEVLSEQAQVPKTSVRAVLDCLSDLALARVTNGEDLVIPGICKVSMKTVQPRIARNPKTGEEVITEEKNKAAIKPVPQFKEAIAALPVSK